jgi:phenylalanyl-tRNA synthetase alpha chain
MSIDTRSLHPLEVRVLIGTAEGDVITAAELSQRLELKLGQCNQALSWLSAKELVTEVDRAVETIYELTDLGNEYAKSGTPQARVLALLGSRGPLALPDIAKELGLEQRDVGSAFGTLSKEGAVAMDEHKRATVTGSGRSPSTDALAAVISLAVERDGSIGEAGLDAVAIEALRSNAKKRGASGAPFRTVESETVRYRLSAAGGDAKRALEAAGATGEEIGAVTPEMLESGEWKGKRFRSYHVQVPPSRSPIGRRNPYSEYLEEVKNKLVSLGFEEFDGPLVETEFWNGDALFMPQFHSARDIHDVYYVAEPTHAREIEQPWLDRVAAAHESGWNTGSSGWGYAFDRDFTRKLVLRSQGTVLSAKQLPKAKVPGKYFGVARCFRYDQVDATHGADFYQTEGIVLGNEVNLKTLLGLLELFAVEVAGAKEFRFAPAYFPFTEPSIEVHIKHPVLGWFELGGSGIFRPEVTEPLGIDVPVLAWGLGIDRMALMQLGLDDLRELFSNDLDRVRMRRRR